MPATHTPFRTESGLIGNWPALAFMLVLAALAVVATGADKETPSDIKRAQDKKKAKAEEKRQASVPFAPGHPLIVLEGVRCQVHHEGRVRQDIQAQGGRYDEKAAVLEMKKLQVKFMDQGTTTVGAVRCGSGRIWTKAQPEAGIASHDMLLQQAVRLETGDKMLLQSPEMRFRATDSVLTTDKGFQEQIPVGSSFLVGKGVGFDIHLLRDKGTFQSLKQYGNPAELRKSDKPVMTP